MTNEILSIILNGLKQAGNYPDCYMVIEEQLPMQVADDVEQFLAWLQDKEYTIGTENILTRWNEFEGLPASTKARFKLEDMEGYAVGRNRKDILAKLSEGDYTGIDLHVFSYPLKRVDVISFDKETKTLTLKIA